MNQPIPHKDLQILSVGQLKDLVFHIPSYQRGYRWERRQVRQLLEDIMESPVNTPYYLQPIVVALIDDNGNYNLIDGQQRMTTLYLIYHALQQINQKKIDAANKADDDMKETFMEMILDQSLNIVPGYRMVYETRKGSEQYLKDLHLDKSKERKSENPDFLYLWHAYQQIHDMLSGKMEFRKKIAEKLQRDVKVIWYELPSNNNEWKKFADLNVGKIPLTNSELIKALFMRGDSSNGCSENEKDIIANQWDEIERQLADSRFWAFLTNKKMEDYATRIDLLFEIVSGITKGDDPYSTFFYFNDDFENKKKKVQPNGKSEWDGKAEWDKIHSQFQLLHDWYKKRKLYHSVGFLVAFPPKDMPKVLHSLIKQRKDNRQGHKAFANELTEKIKSVIALPGDVNSIRDLDYEHHYGQILRLLTLFNILTLDNMDDPEARYSFDRHKNVGGGWSLEHIHAQNSEELNRIEQWDIWITMHIDSLERFSLMRKASDALPDELEKIQVLKDEMESFLKADTKKKSQDWFNRLSRRFYETATSAKDMRLGAEYKDEMANMALLGKWDNSALNNSVFDVKRVKVTDLTQKSFVPLCTQRVFMKVYGEQTNSQPYFWGDKDREAYIDVMEETLGPYLPDGYVSDRKRREQKAANISETTKPGTNDEQQ